MADSSELQKDDPSNEPDADGKAAEHIAPDSGINTPDQPVSAVRNLKRASTTPLLTSTASATSSPKQSREASPVRPLQKQATSLGTPSANRSRKNSQELSPVRAPSIAGSSIPTVPSAAAIQRASSAAGSPHLPSHPYQDAGVEALRPQKVNRASAGNISQSARGTPRLSSPPPSASSGANKPVVSTARKLEQSQSAPSTPKIVVERPNRSAASADPDVAEEDQTSRSGMRTPSRGASGIAPALETVQESSLPATPAISTGKSVQGGKPTERPEKFEENPLETALEKESKSRPDSGNESAGNRSVGPRTGDDGKELRKAASAAATSTKSPHLQSKKSFSQVPAKGKAAGEGSVKNMTVETETVSSVPQVALGRGAGDRNIQRTETGGSLRLKPSNETIRPKDKKKVVRKAPSIKSGTASSKADIFEAKVASAVDEANSTDSEETFVYESNPPEPHSARPHRFHSRTPSATSTISQMDHYGAKARQEGHHSIVAKKSMKFANNYNSINNYSNDSEGTVRGPSQTGRGTGTPHHHHIGRHGHGGHTSLFDNESPFPNATKPSRSSPGHTHFSPRNASQRNSHAMRISGSPRKAEEILSYDLEGEGADDERAPLMGSMRSGRNRRRPLPGSVRQMYYNEERGNGYCTRVLAFTSLGGLLAILIAATVLVLVLCTKPLENVHVKDIQNILASEAEIMLDLNVHAINPNIIAVQVNDLDVNIFAKSKHVGTSSLWRSVHSHILPPGMSPRNKIVREPSSGTPFRTPADIIDQLHGIDEGTDPPDDDPAADSQTMLLGQIFEFDSPLIFSPSPIQHGVSSSTGEVRLARPGNNTEEGGSARWEHVLQHEFELIVRGVIKYTLPINSKTRSASIGGSVIVHPSGDVDRIAHVNQEMEAKSPNRKQRSHPDAR